MNEQATRAPDALPDESAHVRVLSQPTPSHIAAERGADVARTLYSSAEEFRVAVPDKAFDGAQQNAPAREAAVVELRRMFADTGLAPNDAARLMTRAGLVRSAGQTEEQQRRETRTALEQRYGKDADSVLTDVRKLVARDPRFKQFVDLRGVGNDAESVLILAQAARSLKAAGKLK